MVLTTGPNRARWSGRVRLAILAVVALLLAHTAIYTAEDGLGAAFAMAMARDGHGDWWLPASLVVLAAGLALAVWAAVRLARLEILASRVTWTPGRDGSRPSRDGRFGREAGAIAWRLIPLVLCLFAIQENVEQLVAHGRLLGVEAIVGPAHPLAVPVLAIVCLGLSLLGALVRWRIASLDRRIAHGASPRRQRLAAERIGGRWRTIGALAPRRWMLDRLDAGRSPPAVLPS